MQNSIDYIESNLNTKLELKEISKVAGFSIAHFYRIFQAMVGCSVKGYIRKRRFSNAIYSLVSTKRDIIDIAFDCSYESHEAFSRAFKSYYGISPRNARKMTKEPSLYYKVNLLLNNKKEVNIMKPEIICKEELKLVGISKKMNQADNVVNNLIGKVQQAFKGQYSIIKNRINSGLFYAAYDYAPEDLEKDDEDINYTYYYCIAVSAYLSIPDGMITKTIPQAKYAKFVLDIEKHTLNGEALEGDVYDYIDGVWVPNSGIEISETSDFEVIDPASKTIEYYIGVK